MGTALITFRIPCSNVKVMLEDYAVAAFVDRVYHFVADRGLCQQIVEPGLSVVFLRSFKSHFLVPYQMVQDHVELSAVGTIRFAAELALGWTWSTWSAYIQIRTLSCKALAFARFCCHYALAVALVCICKHACSAYMYSCGYCLYIALCKFLSPGFPGSIRHTWHTASNCIRDAHHQPADRSKSVVSLHRSTAAE
jgi:hypothetical protein